MVLDYLFMQKRNNECPFRGLFGMKTAKDKLRVFPSITSNFRWIHFCFYRLNVCGKFEWEAVEAPAFGCVVGEQSVTICILIAFNSLKSVQA